MKLVAHAGGIGPDEVAFIAIPIVLLVILQFVGRRKVAKAENERTLDDEENDVAP